MDLCWVAVPSEIKSFHFEEKLLKAGCFQGVVRWNTIKKLTKTGTEQLKKTFRKSLRLTRFTNPPSPTTNVCKQKRQPSHSQTSTVAWKKQRSAELSRRNKDKTSYLTNWPTQKRAHGSAVCSRFPVFIGCHPWWDELWQFSALWVIFYFYKWPLTQIPISKSKFIDSSSWIGGGGIQQEDCQIFLLSEYQRLQDWRRKAFGGEGRRGCVYIKNYLQLCHINRDKDRGKDRGGFLRWVLGTLLLLTASSMKTAVLA